MVFSSVEFVFLFLPVVLTGYFLLPFRVRNVFLLVASLAFYAWGEPIHFGLMVASIAMNYGFGLWIEGAPDARTARFPLTLAIIANLQLLGIFKYSGFIVENLYRWFGFGAPPITSESIHLPIGISFFTFQAMSYVVDVYRKDATAQRNPLNLALYIALFPQLIAGPIVRYQQIADALRARVSRLEDIAEGARRFVAGLAKKVLIANTVALPADRIFELPADELTMSLAWLGIVCYTLQIYFDFSGYSDMAIGLGRIFGFHYLENFQWPYVARSIREFWRRWHISLSTWFRDYLYIPLGGNRRGAGRTHVNLLIVFFLCGLWHGAAWTFVIWGLYHGAFLVLERTRVGDWLAAWPRALQHGYTLLVVMIGWVFFRAETFAHAIEYLLAMAGFAAGSPIVQPLPLYLTTEVSLAILMGCIFSSPIAPSIGSKLATQRISRRAIGLSVSRAIAYCALFYLTAVYISAQTYNPFIYFRF